TYIGTMPLSGDVPSALEQSTSGWPRTPVSSAIMAKVGAAARDSQSMARRAATSSLAVSWGVIIVVDSCDIAHPGYSSSRRHQTPVSLRPLGARSSHGYTPQMASTPRAYVE